MSYLLSHKDLKAEAQRLGFSVCGCAPAAPVEEWRRRQWEHYLAHGHHAGMDYLENHLDKRLDPRLLVDGAKTVVSLALNYYQGDACTFGSYEFARYAVGRDYHEVVKERLLALLNYIKEMSGNQVEGRAFCDTAPVDEHYWAWRCGLGWLGRNTQLIVPHAGSHFFLGELILTAACDAYDVPQTSHCGQCQRCINACPTGALSADDGLDARRCLSYLTIEHRGPFPSELPAPPLGNCIYGCDRCIAACPHNHKAPITSVSDFFPRPELIRMTAAEWQSLTQEQFSRIFSHSAVKRTKLEGLLRNIQCVNTVDDAPMISLKPYNLQP